jgi:nuclease S1
MRKIFLVIITASLLSVPVRSFAWGAKGHQLVAEIAFHFLDSATKQKVMKYLKNMSIEEAATWMDEMRSNDYYNYMKSWHYINMDSGQVYKPSAEYNIVTVLNTAIDELKHQENLKAKEINNDLLLIFHLSGDLTQPLHVGYGVDRGGNDIQVSFLSKQDKTNLHYVWDNGIIDSKNINMDSCLQLYANYTPAEIAKIKKINILDWLNESRSYLPEIYNFKDGFISQEYVDRNTTIVEQQLLFGGLHLASILEQLFK